MFALIDCNNFYASCERVFRPDLNGKPIVVLSNNDGCVIARSNEAKDAGIPMGAPAFKYKETFEQHNIHVFSSNYALYGDMSNRVMQLLATYAPQIEVYSIDEAFLKFESCPYIDLDALAIQIKNEVSKSTGIPISVGFAKTKALAKVANKIAKKFNDRLQGVYTIDSEEKRLKALKWLKVEDVWGIGRQNAKRLAEIGVRTAYDFTLQSDEWVLKNMSVVGSRLKKDLEGIAILDLEKTKVKKNIATTRSFDKDYSEFEQVKERVSTFAISCAEKLRKQKSNCGAIVVFVQTNGHKKHAAQYAKSITLKLPYPSNSNIELSRFALNALKCIFKLGYNYKKAGVIVMDITPENCKQISLFENSDARHKTLMQSIDKINKSNGKQIIKLGSQDMQKTWKMKQEKLSPCYTTRLSDVFKVSA